MFLKNHPGKRPKKVWGSGKIMCDNVDDDDDDDHDVWGKNTLKKRNQQIRKSKARPFALLKTSTGSACGHILLVFRDGVAVSAMTCRCPGCPWALLGLK